MSNDGRPRRCILIVDDDGLFCDATREFLQSDGRAVLTTHTARDALEVARSSRVDVVLLDQNLPDAEGHTICSKILAANDRAKIVFITAHPSFDGAVKAIRAGAVDYMSKPFEPEELALAVDREIRTLDLEDVAVVARYRTEKEGETAVLVGAGGGLAETAKLVGLAAEAGAPVLLSGETGTGKNVAAKVIHYASRRRSRPFISVNCAALPENLIETELFGHEKGAFTGAASQRRGVFEMAHGGTLFLDEIGEMPLHLQAKLLTVLEDGQVKRLGGESAFPVDVLVIAATGADLEKALGETFRRDLYFRVSVMRIHVPPLRERRQDIPVLCEHFLKMIAGRSSPEIPEAEMRRLQAYDWPGNVRELRNILERAAILQRGPVLRPSELLGPAAEASTDAHESSDRAAHILPLDEIERRHIRSTLDTLDHNYTRTAKALGIALSTLKRKVRRYGLR